MVRLTKLYQAEFYERKNKKPFATNRVAAQNYEHAVELALEWGTEKWGRRLIEVKVCTSKKGEIIADS